MAACAGAANTYSCLLGAWTPHAFAYFSLYAELLDLRERFEADKKRLADLRGARKWKPY